MPEKQEVLQLELVDKRNSNFFLDGTDHNPIFLNAPDMCWIPNQAFRAKEVVDANGKKKIVHEKIRYIENDTSIVVEDQEARKVIFDKKQNKIQFEKSYISIPKTPENETLCEYLLTAFWNKSAPHRPAGATALYDVIKIVEKAEKLNDDDEKSTKAKYVLFGLRKKEGDGYVYDEAKLNAYCNLLNVYGDNEPSVQFRTLLTIASNDPERFLSLVSVFDNTVKTEVQHAFEMKIISFDDGVAAFSDGNKIIKPLTTEKTNKDKITAVADFLNTPEGTHLLTELRARVEAEKNKKLTNK